MNDNKISLWQRFKSAVPATERKIQLILAAAAATFGSMAAITFPGHLAIVGTLAGYLAAACGGMAFVIQFAMQTQTIIQTQDEVKVTTTSTTTSTDVPVGSDPQPEVTQTTVSATQVSTATTGSTGN